MLKIDKCSNQISFFDFFCEDEERIGSFVAVRERHLPDAYMLKCLAIHKPENRNKGLGTQMMTEFLREYGVDTDVYLQVLCDNAPALALYHKMGFEILDPSATYFFTMKRPKGKIPA